MVNLIDLSGDMKTASKSYKVPLNRSLWGAPRFAMENFPSSSSSSAPASPSSMSGTTMGTQASENAVSKLNQPDIHGDDAVSPLDAATSKKKKRVQRAVSGDKSGRGLRQFSMQVCKKVESKGITTYNEVADELVAEFSIATADQLQDDEKNIRRRVYDALNVLTAMDIISKNKKEIQWKGLPHTSLNDTEELKGKRLRMRNNIEKKAAYLRELQDQYADLQNLLKRNEKSYRSGNAPSGVVALPFILIQTRPDATVELEISEDMQLVHFDFNSTPFQLRDESCVLKEMRGCATKNGATGHDLITEVGKKYSNFSEFQQQIKQSASTNNTSMFPGSAIPGILKSSAKHEG